MSQRSREVVGDAQVELMPSTLPRWWRGLLARCSGIEALEGLSQQIPAHLDAGGYTRRGLELIGVDFSLDPGELARVPEHGSIVVVANHPYGAVDGLIALAALRGRRPDVLVMARDRCVACRRWRRASCRSTSRLCSVPM